MRAFSLGPAAPPSMKQPTAGAVIAASDQSALQLRFLRPVEFLQAAGERRGIVAAVVFGLGFVGRNLGDVIGHLGLRNEIAPPELDAVDTKIVRDKIEQPLAEKIRLEAARTAIGARRRLVGELHRDIEIDVRNAVRPRHELRDVARRHETVGADIGADIRPGVAAQAENRSVAAAGDLDVAVRVARVLRRHQVLAAVLGPFDRAAGAARGKRYEEIFGIKLAARAEAAADIVLDEIDLVFGKTELLGQHAAVEERDLGGAVQHEPAFALVPFGEQAARLHGDGGVAIDAKMLAPDVGRVAKRRDRVAEHGGVFDRLVAAVLLEQQRLVARGGMAIGDRRQRIDVDLDGVRGVFGDRDAVGEHERQRFADIAHLAVRQHRLLERNERRHRLQAYGDGRNRRAEVGAR